MDPVLQIRTANGFGLYKIYAISEQTFYFKNTMANGFCLSEI